MKILYEGHYRALEEDFRKLVAGLPDGGGIWVTASGAGPLRRLRELFLESTGRSVVAGIDFFPGFAHLACKLARVPVSVETVSAGDRILFTLRAMSSLPEGLPFHPLKDNPDTALSLGTFFERLFDYGVTPEMYRQVTMSLPRDPTVTEATVGGLFASYGETRSRRYSNCSDMILDSVSGIPPETMIFYGFYDLNPGQRRFLRKLLARGIKVYWFSPVSDGSAWREIYGRTRSFLEEMGFSTVVRSDGAVAMNDFGIVFEEMGVSGGVTAVPRGLSIISAAGETGACRAVLKTVQDLHGEGIPFERVAVVRRKADGGSLVRMAVHEGLPVNEPLRSRLADLPVAGFVADVLKAVTGGMHVGLMEKVLSHGILAGDLAVNSTELLNVSASSGIRYGPDRWLEWSGKGNGSAGLVRFVREMGNFTKKVSKPASPSGFMAALGDLAVRISSLNRDSVTWNVLFDVSAFRHEEKVAFTRFAAAYRAYLESVGMILREADSSGFRVLSPERLRGDLFDAVIFMDLEEGVFPGKSTEDPRLEDELRKMLQLSPVSMKEKEELLLLRQAGEAAGKRMVLVYTGRSASGSETAPSPFLVPLLDRMGEDGPEFSRQTSSPVVQLLGGTHPGQRTAMEALSGKLSGSDPLSEGAAGGEAARMDHGRPFDEFDGILGYCPVPLDEISPTMLEEYAACPFAFLAARCWVPGRRIRGETGSEPDPFTRGRLMHEVVEWLVEHHGFRPGGAVVKERMESAAKAHRLEESLGSRYLVEIFVERESETILNSLDTLADRNWRFFGAEVDLHGELAGTKIHGRIDLVLEDSDSGLILLDLKTGILPLRKSVTGGLKYQLPFYYLLARNNFPEREVASVAYVSISRRDPGKLMEFGGRDIESMKDTVRMNVETLVGMMREGLFPPVPTTDCGHCAFKDLCRKTPDTRLAAKVGVDERMGFFRERLKVK